MSDLLFALWSLLALATLSICFIFDCNKNRLQSSCRLGLYAVLLNFILVIGATSHDYRLRDYGAYEKAAIAFCHGDNLYIASYHLNFPLIGECLAKTYQGLDAILLNLQPNIPDNIVLVYMFCLFQCLQLLFIGWGYWLSCRWLNALGLTQERTALICAALWLLSWPVYLTVEKGQINILMVDLTLLALLWIESHPLAAGLVLSIAFFLKYYPLALPAAAVIARRWKLVGAFVSGILLMIVVQTAIGGVGIWSEFFQAIQIKQLANPLIDVETQMQPSIANAVFEICRTLSPATVENEGANIRLVSLLITALIICWFVCRIIVRERTYQLCRQLNGSKNKALELARFYGHAADLLSAALLTSPHVWQNHYVMALPLILWAIAQQNYMSPLMLSAIALILVGNYFQYGTAIFLAVAHLKPLGLILLAIAQDPKLLREVNQPAISNQAIVIQLLK